jgi:DNA-directed RNA polymerase specialized sigma24 family protein
MLCDEPPIRDALAGIVRSVTGRWDWHGDLLQEALIHLWQKESQSPGQATSWYLYNCRCYLCDCLRRGVSVDSPKHSSCRCELNDEFSESEPVPDCLILDEEVVSSTCADDVLEQLTCRLDAINRRILFLLAEGFNERETGEQVGLSQPAVHNRRLRIANLSASLGFLLPKA